MRFRTDGRHITTQIITWYCSLKKSAQIALAVCLAHFAAIIWMSVDYYFSYKPPIRRPISVRTIQPANPIHVATAPSCEPSVASPPQSTPAPITAKKTRPAAAAPKKKPAPTRPIPAHTLQQIEDSFAALSQPAPKKSASQSKIQLPAAIVAKSNIQASVEEMSSISMDYHIRLVDHLQGALLLPETGEVRLKIAIVSPGKLASVEILDTKSKKNAEWLKNQLPLLDLPCFNDYNIIDPLLEFTITFRNAENT
ncbi:MAG: hypothetical protein HW387_1254 [Parachlamydiales bacterium]|nr:hypothetical protein [Parachlamydiales bacterium]